MADGPALGDRPTVTAPIKREAADLCRLAPPQARRVLRALVARGELVLRGARRGAYYERPIQ